MTSKSLQSHWVSILLKHLFIVHLFMCSFTQRVFLSVYSVIGIVLALNKVDISGLHYWHVFMSSIWQSEPTAGSRTSMWAGGRGSWDQNHFLGHTDKGAGWGGQMSEDMHLRGRETGTMIWDPESQGLAPSTSTQLQCCTSSRDIICPNVTPQQLGSRSVGHHHLLFWLQDDGWKGRLSWLWRTAVFVNKNVNRKIKYSN